MCITINAQSIGIEAIELEKGTIKAEHKSGIYVQMVYPGTPASKLGMRTAAVITSINGTKVKSVKHFQRLCKKKNVKIKWFPAHQSKSKTKKVSTITDEQHDAIAKQVGAWGSPTKTNFDQIKKGMELARVHDILGLKFDVIDENGKKTTMTRQWRNEKGGICAVTFKHAPASSWTVESMKQFELK